MFYYSLQKQFTALPAPINWVAEEAEKLEIGSIDIIKIYAYILLTAILIYIKAKIYNTSLRRIYV